MLLRRQRFLRSLTDFTVDPSLKWVGALDAAYHDQAQFVRDFREFMGMTPTEYGQRDKPVVERVLRERVRYMNEKMQRNIMASRKAG
jgi:methylphosphotriester-DNA--protein-cysteine methyltransferase